ncbi:ATP-binding protein [Streptomyces sp. NPDC051567]|uniref:ATP-binding protein n=1 Tax=Streptomyces sp. NPDC051567 TaxID=3365660 RepID=UPI00378EEA94
MKLVLSLLGDPTLARVGRGLDDFLAPLSLAPLSLAPEVRSAVHLAVHEAALNALRHAGGEGGTTATLELAVDDGCIVATVTDDGPGFDPVAVPDPRTTDRLRRPHGRGIFLMRHLMDRVDFDFPVGGGTRVTLRRSFTHAARHRARHSRERETTMSVTSTITPDGSKLIITVKGRFDFSTHQEFRESYEKFHGQQPETVVVDLAESTYIDSAALGMLLLLRDHMGGDASRISIVNSGPDTRKLLAIANFDKLFDIS